MTDSIPSTPDKSGEPKRICPACKMELKQNGHYVPPSMMEPGFYICDPSEVRAVESLAPSGESGVPKTLLQQLDTAIEACETLLARPEYADHVTTGDEAVRRAFPGLLAPPVSSPEKPEQLIETYLGWIESRFRKIQDEELIVGRAKNIAASALAVDLPGLREAIARLVENAQWDATLERTADKLSNLGDEALREASSLPTDEEVERLLDDIVSRIRPVIAGLQQRIDALYTGLTEVQQERDSYHREASKPLKDIDHAKAIARGALGGDSCAVEFETAGEWMAALLRSRDLWRDSVLRGEDRIASLETTLIAVQKYASDRISTLEQQLADATQKARYESDVARQAVAALATAERERDEAREDLNAARWAAEQVRRSNLPDYDV